MAEYIDRNYIVKAYIDLCKALNQKSKICPGADEPTVKNVFAIVMHAPAADVAPVVHGKWEPGNPICPVCGENKFKDLDADVWADWQPKFCPNCGARMGKEDEHEIG